MQTYPTGYAESHRIAEQIFREILPRHGMAVREEQIALCHEVLDTLYNKQETEQARAEGRQPMLIRHFSVHNLRHTFCTRFCENETNLKVIQDIMGHADITTTMNIYAEATKEKKQEAMANLNGKIKIM